MKAILAGISLGFGLTRAAESEGFDLSVPLEELDQHSGGICAQTSYCDGKMREDPTRKDGRSAVAWMESPPDCPNHHAGFLHELPNGGGLGLVWHAGHSEFGPGVRIWYSRLAAGSSQWTKPKAIGADKDWGMENPNLFTDPVTKYLYAHYTAVPVQHSSEHYAHIWRSVSKDGLGETWEKPVDFYPHNTAFTRNRVIQLSTDRWIFPISHASGSFTGKGGCDFVDGNPHENADHSGILMSHSKDPSPLDWPETLVKGSGCRVHPSVIDLGNGLLRTIFRSRVKDNIYFMESKDNGKTWTEPKKTKAPNDNASLQWNIVWKSKYAKPSDVPPTPSNPTGSQVVVAIYDNTNDGRYPLTIMLSYDGGVTFPYIRDLETNSIYPGHSSHEYSYPSVLQASDGYIYASSTYNRDTIKVQKVTEDWIRESTSSSGKFKGGHFVDADPTSQTIVV